MQYNEETLYLTNMENQLRIEYKPDFEVLYGPSLNYDEEDRELNEQEDQIFQEILALEDEIKGGSHLMDDLLEAAKDGALRYVDAMTDTEDTFSDLKNPDSERTSDSVNITRKNMPADPVEAAKIKEAPKKSFDKSPFDSTAAGNTQGMSAEGARKFERSLNAYAQRTKSVTRISKKSEGMTIKTSDPKENFESLSGLRSYRIGPTEPMQPVSDTLEEFREAKVSGKEFDNAKKIADWVRDRDNGNFDKFDERLVKEYGFKDVAAAKKWRTDNHLTIHEGPEGMYLVPTVIHQAASHTGYVSKIAAFLKADGSEEKLKELNNFISQEKIELVKHEAKVRGTRMVRGLGMAIIKDILKFGIAVTVKEVFLEFKKKSDEPFANRMIAILRRCLEKVKAKFKSVWTNLFANVKSSALTEFLTMINDYLLGTFKNIFKFVRQMWSSIKSAFKIIVSKEYSWQEKVFEASKILSAGFVSIIGFSLNELIENGLASIGIPYASFIAECLSGLFAGVMSSVVLMLFDSYKKQMKVRSAQARKMQLESKAVMINMAQLSLSTVKIQDMGTQSLVLFANSLDNIDKSNAQIQIHGEASRRLAGEMNTEIEQQKQRNNRLENLINKYEDEDF